MFCRSLGLPHTCAKGLYTVKKSHMGTACLYSLLTMAVIVCLFVSVCVCVCVCKAFLHHKRDFGMDSNCPVVSMVYLTVRNLGLTVYE